ncbi:hypothetical protein ATCV1_z128R [Acanthocystis turfacea chlorella virus 1]|uniref:Uncharacterized protein z128R n=1 Tax=Chlorovirus heliozoae TaxID=322019 RepID=A7K888_9PHYC|nr:hypothetical protein ATCV1_z128R [Acanthocystis turfacea chlorella virus 1]ABT16262.1 hypothetical protein ATCV1_z128R [Acanthocystis turfacea chlorella virus 1]
MANASSSATTTTEVRTPWRPSTTSKSSFSISWLRTVTPPDMFPRSSTMPLVQAQFPCTMATCLTNCLRSSPRVPAVPTSTLKDETL